MSTWVFIFGGEEASGANRGRVHIKISRGIGLAQLLDKNWIRWDPESSAWQGISSSLGQTAYLMTCT